MEAQRQVPAAPEYLKSEYEVARENMTEATIENNLAVLDGGGPDPQIAASIEFWAAEARRLAESSNDITIQ